MRRAGIPDPVVDEQATYGLAGTSNQLDRDLNPIIELEQVS